MKAAKSGYTIKKCFFEMGKEHKYTLEDFTYFM
jgi:hypothetical protein